MPIRTGFSILVLLLIVVFMIFTNCLLFSFVVAIRSSDEQKMHPRKMQSFPSYLFFIYSSMSSPREEKIKLKEKKRMLEKREIAEAI